MAHLHPTKGESDAGTSVIMGKGPIILFCGALHSSKTDMSAQLQSLHYMLGEPAVCFEFYYIFHHIKHALTLTWSVYILYTFSGRNLRCFLFPFGTQ